jgi:hypothetical protein
MVQNIYELIVSLITLSIQTRFWGGDSLVAQTGSLLGILIYYCSTVPLLAMILRFTHDVRCRVVTSVPRALLLQQQQPDTAAGAAVAAAASAAINSLARCEILSTTRGWSSCYTQSITNPYSGLNLMICSETCVEK